MPKFPKGWFRSFIFASSIYLIYFLILFAGILSFHLFPLSTLSSTSLFLLGPFSQSLNTFKSLLSEINKGMKTKAGKGSLALNFASHSLIQQLLLYLFRASYCCGWWRRKSCFPPGASEGTELINIQTTKALLQLCDPRLRHLVPSLEHLPSALSVGWCGLSDRVRAGFQSPGPLGLHRLAQMSSAVAPYSLSPASLEE